MNTNERFIIQHPIAIEHVGSMGGVPVPGLTHYGRSMNLSFSGVAVTLAYSFNIANGSRVEIVLQPKDFGAADGRAISFQAEVVWRKANQVGLKIQNMDQITSARYQTLLIEAQGRKSTTAPPPPPLALMSRSAAKK